MSSISGGGGGVTNGLAGTSASKKMVAGVASITGTAQDVATGLTTVIAAGAVIADNISAAAHWASASIGDQAGAPAAGSIRLGVWKATAAGNTAPIAAVAATNVNWWAYGT